MWVCPPALPRRPGQGQARDLAQAGIAPILDTIICDARGVAPMSAHNRLAAQPSSRKSAANKSTTLPWGSPSRPTKRRDRATRLPSVVGDRWGPAQGEVRFDRLQRLAAAPASGLGFGKHANLLNSRPSQNCSTQAEKVLAWRPVNVVQKTRGHGSPNYSPNGRRDGKRTLTDPTLRPEIYVE